MSIKRNGLSNKLTAFLKDQSFHCDVTGPSTAQIVMLRGCKINDDGSISGNGKATQYTDRYDDVLIVYGQKAKGQPFLEMFKATAKPGLAWIHHPSYAGSGQGCPTVQPCQVCYGRGDHRGHEAMRQVGQPIPVIRDLNDNAKLEPTDKLDYPIWTGINIHAGGVSNRIGLNSSGCQVIWGGWEGTPWKTFHNIIYKVAKQQKIFHYTVVDFDMFAQWHDHPPFKNILFGSYGKSVSDFQRKLVASGYLGSALVDGKWGMGTDRAVRYYQKAINQPANGIIKVS